MTTMHYIIVNGGEQKSGCKSPAAWLVTRKADVRFAHSRILAVAAHVLTADAEVYSEGRQAIHRPVQIELNVHMPHLVDFPGLDTPAQW